MSVSQKPRVSSRDAWQSSGVPGIERRFGVLVAFALIAGCGDGSALAPSDGTSAGAGGGAGGGGPIGGGGTGGAGLPPLVMSVLPEEGLGNEPSMVRFANQTQADLLSLAIGDGQLYAFVEVPAGTTTAFLPKALVALDTWVEVGVCNTGICVPWPVNEYIGVTDLQPAQAYTLQIDDPAPSEYRLQVLGEDPPAPFVGARAQVDAPGNGPPDKAVRLELTLAQGDPLVFEDAYAPGSPSQYVAVDGEAIAIETVTFRDRSNRVYSLQGGGTVSGAGGYTFVVTTTEVEGAVLSLWLEAEPL